jgi:predicted nucleotidyltransferase
VADQEFALFGSVLTDEFRADSDVDVLITFEDPKPDLGPWGGAWETMREDLQTLFGRRVDLVEKKLVATRPPRNRNPAYGAGISRELNFISSARTNSSASSTGSG